MIGTDVAVIPCGTTTTTAATAATATRQHGARNWTSRFGLCSQDGGENSGGIYYDPTPGDDGLSAGGKRRLIQEEGFASQVSGHVRPRDPGVGTVPIVPPRRMSNDDSRTVPGGGGGGGGGLNRSSPTFRRCGSKRP